MKRFLFGIVVVSAIAVATGCGNDARPQAPSPASQAGSSANAPAAEPLQLLKQSNYVCLLVSGLQHSGIDTVIPGGLGDAIPLTWDGLNFSASLPDSSAVGRNGAPTQLTYSGTIAADGQRIDSLSVYSSGPNPSAEHAFFANIPYVQEAGRPAQTSGWRVSFTGADASRLFMYGASLPDGGGALAVGGARPPLFVLAFGISPQQASCARG